MPTSPKSTLSVSRFPFLNASPDVLGKAIIESDALIGACVRRRLPAKYESHFEDVQQEVRIALINALPHFDASLGFQLTTFLYRCIHRALAGELARLDAEPPTESIESDPLTADDGFDVAGLADSILADPSFLTTGQRELLRLRAAGL